MVDQKKQSLAELTNNWITEKVKAKYDYSTATSRQQDIQNFMQAHKSQISEEQFKLKTVRDSFIPQLKKVYNRFDIDPKSLGLDKKKLKYNPKINSTITPDPQSGKTDTSPKEKPTGQIKTGVIDPNTGQQMVVPEIFDEQAVSAVFSALFLTFRLAVPDMELLTDNEKESLGKIWKPAFNMYFSNEKWAMLGIPTIATLGIALPKILEGRKKGKIRKSKEEGLLRQKEIDGKNETQQQQIDKAKKENQTKPPEIIPENKPSIGQISTEITPTKTTLTLPKETKEN